MGLLENIGGSPLALAFANRQRPVVPEKLHAIGGFSFPRPHRMHLELRRAVRAAPDTWLANEIERR